MRTQTKSASPKKKVTETAAPLAARPDQDFDPALALLCARAVIDKKAIHNIILNVGAAGSFTDYFLISSGTSEPQVQAMADEIVKRLKARGMLPRVEGYDQGRWILIDAGSVIAHLFHDDIRSFYKLEELWLGAPRVEIPQEYYTSPSLS